MSAARDFEEVRADEYADTESLDGNESRFTQSLKSSILEGVQENGRRYHRYKGIQSTIDFPIPEDEIEQERLELQHQLFLITFKGKLCLAPIKGDPKHVLDLGTGTGTWAIQFAEEHPNSNVIGTDISMMQPSYVSPPNLKFELDDFNSEWMFTQKFSFINARGLTGASSDFKLLAQRAYDALEPGGYLEMDDIFMPFLSDDGTLDGTALDTWTNRQVAACAKLGMDTGSCSHYKEWLTEIGFEDVHEFRYKWPIGSWPKDPKLKQMGKLTMVNFLTGIEGFTTRLWTSVLGMPIDEVMNYLDLVKKDIRNPKIHSYWPVYAVYGRKPGAT